MPQLRKYKRGGKTFPDLTGDGKVTRADILKGRGAFRRKKREQGIGGAVLGGVNALMQGKGLAGAVKQGVQGFMTPGSGISQGLQFAGNLAGKSDNPMLQNLGRVANVASSFAPGGGGVMNALTKLPGMFQQQAAAGMKVGPKIKYANEGTLVTNDQTDGEVMRQEMLAQRQSEREMENSGGLERRALDASRGVDMDRGISGQLDSGAAYSGPKYRMAELNEISRGVYGKDIDYDRLAASMGNASSKHKAALSNILANQTAMNEQRMGGVVLKKSQGYGGKVMEEGGLGDPPRADFLTRSPELNEAILEEARDLSTARSDRQSAFGTSSTDVYMPIGNLPIIYSSERPEPLDPLERIGPRLIKRGEEKGIVGGYKEMPDTSKGPSADLIYFNPKTSNIRTFIPTDDDRFDGARPFGQRGFEDEDKIPYGFRENGKSVYATPAALDKMKEEGVGARGAAAEDYMIELYRSNPDLFTTSPQGGHRSKIQIQQRVLNEAKTRQPGVPGFYIPTTPSKASF